MQVIISYISLDMYKSTNYTDRVCFAEILLLFYYCNYFYYSCSQKLYVWIPGVKGLKQITYCNFLLINEKFIP